MIKIIAVVVTLLMSYFSFGQKVGDSIGCKDLTTIMNNKAVVDFLQSNIHGSVFENNHIIPKLSTALGISCKSFEIGNRNYKILDSTELNSYRSNQIIQISAIETHNKVLLYLEWMEVAAEFQVIRTDKGFNVKLNEIIRLD